MLQDAAPVVSGKRVRKEPARFEAGPTQVNGSLKLHRAPEAAAAPKAPQAPRSRPDNKLRAARRKEAKAAYIASLSKLADETFIDLSWKMRRVVAVCAYARSLECGCGKMAAASIASICSRVHERTTRRWVKEWLANEGFFHPMNWGMHRKAPQFLDDEEISSKASRWLRLNTGFKKGRLISSVFLFLIVLYACCEVGCHPQTWQTFSSSSVGTKKETYQAY